MPRISINLSNDDHERLAAVAAIHGQSVEDYMLSYTLSNELLGDESRSIEELRKFLNPRIEAAEAGSVEALSMKKIKAEARLRTKASP